MTKEQLAAKLNGREYLEEITKEEEALAKKHGLVVVFGYSDDNTEFRGAIYDELGCYDGGVFYIDKRGMFDGNHECDCDDCGYKNRSVTASKIEAVWCGDEGYSWTYRTSIPHATFDIMEDGEKFCRGIVFEMPKE